MYWIFKTYFVLINIISFLLYYIDKKKAIKHKYRIPEKILIMTSIMGGCFGSIFSMYLFHHKTKHLKFKILVPLFCLVWLFFIFKKFYNA